MKTGTWIDCTLCAKPTSKGAKRKTATAIVTFAVEGDDCPSREIADRLCNAPVLLDAAEARIAKLEAALRRWGTWCHSPDAMNGPRFHAAVEGTPDEFFPEEASRG